MSATQASGGGLRAGAPVWVFPVTAAALLFVFLGERVLSTINAARWALTGAGLALLFATTVLR